jgi:hypothetical protein
VLDILIAVVMGVVILFSVVSANTGAAMITAMVEMAAGSILCALVALVAGLLGAPRRLVFAIAALPPIVLIALLVAISKGAV